MTTHPALMAATSGGAGAGAAAAAASTSHSQSHLHLDAGAAISTSGGPASTSQSSSSSSYPIEPLRSPPYNASTSNNQGSSKVAAWTALPRAGCSRIIEQEEEDQLMTSGGPSTSSQGIMGAGTSPPQQRRKRARHGIKIKRNRKITSCLACRERKQKCDRTHPVCEKCIEDGRQCIYVDNDSTLNDDDCSEDPRPATTGSAGPSSRGGGDGGEGGPLGGGSLERGPGEAFYERRRAGVRHSYDLSRSRHLPFQERVKAARAAAVSEVLFQQNGAPHLPCSAPIRLPTREQAQPLLDLYKAHVESICNIVLVDLNRARIGSFLDWWHSNPDSLPPEADSPLAPLVLVVLALAIQAHRARSAMDKFDPSTMRTPDEYKASHHVSVYDFVSPERALLETAGRCINALQITCPSSWATTYSAPLDVIRAETLRALWHLGECHLQFANSCFTVAVRLAYAAHLHRDPTHFHETKMSTFEMQARRSAWWNLATLEVFHAFRIGQPTSLALTATDTALPANFDCIVDQYEITRNEHGRPNKVAHDALVARFNLARLMIEKGASIFGISDSKEAAVRKLHDVQDIGARWNASLPQELVSKMNAVDAAPELAWIDETVRWQSVGLQLNHLQLVMSSHRIGAEQLKAEAAGNSLPPQSSRYHICIDAARRLIALCYKAIIGRPAAPSLILNVISYYAFNTGCMLAMQSVSALPMPELVNPVLDQTLAVLDQMGNNEGLDHISEQAERYAKTIREIMKNRPPPPEGQPLHSRSKVPPSPPAVQQHCTSPESGHSSSTPVAPMPGGSRHGGPPAAQSQTGSRPSLSPALPQRGSSASSWSPPDQVITSSPMSAPAASTVGVSNVPPGMETFRPASYPRAISSTSSTDGQRRDGGALTRSPTSMSTLSSTSSSYNRDLFARQTDFNSLEERMLPNNNISTLSFLTSSMFGPHQGMPMDLSQSLGNQDGITHPQHEHQQQYQQGSAPLPIAAASSSSAASAFSSPLQSTGMATSSGSNSTDWTRSSAGAQHQQNGIGAPIDRRSGTFSAAAEHSHAFQPMGSSADMALIQQQRISASPHGAHHYHHHPQQHNNYQEHQHHPHHHHHHRHMSHGAATQSSSMPPPMLPLPQSMSGAAPSSWPNSMTGGGVGDVNSYAGMPAAADMGTSHDSGSLAHPHLALPLPSSSSSADMDAAARHQQQQSVDMYISTLLQGID